MRSTLPTRSLWVFPWQFGLLAGAFVSASLLGSVSYAQSANTPGPPAATTPQKTQAAKAQAHRHSKKKEEPPPVVQAPPPPPPPDWPANNPPSPASVVWDSNGLHVNASNSSLQQILREISTDTGTKIEGSISDRRVYGEYGPGHVSDVLAQLLQGSGYNFLLTGDLGQGAPREIVLSPRRAVAPNANNGYRPPQQQADEDVPDEPEDQPVQPPPSPVQQPQAQQPPQTQNNPRQGFGPNGPIRTPQQVMEEMQQRQQQLQQQQQQQANPQQQ